MKSDYINNGIIYDESYEYLTVSTDKGTLKRIKISDLAKSNRANRGILILREVKTNPHKVLKTLMIGTKAELGIKSNDEIKVLKNSEIPIMDRYSTGSSFIKEAADLFEVRKLESTDLEEKPIEKEDVSLEEVDQKILTIDDFLKNFDTDK